MTRPEVGFAPEMGFQPAPSVPTEPAVAPAPAVPSKPALPATETAAQNEPSVLSAPIAGPCGQASAAVQTRCADAIRLLQAAQSHQQILREARRELDEVTRDSETDVGFRDRRQIADRKAASQAEYRTSVLRATDAEAVQVAAAEWMRQIDQLNRLTRIADQRADSLSRRADELRREIPSLELAADAARIAAEAGQVACLEARQTLAMCEEDNQRQVAPQPANLREHAAASAGAAATEAAGLADGETGSLSPNAVIHGLMRGDRQQMLGLALSVADETGSDAGHLQLLLLELREQVVARALEVFALAFPEEHPFWSQFSADGARRVASSMASMGFSFDGVGGWVDDRAPAVRDLALALSYCGYDPRTLRRPASQTAIDGLWQGTSVLAEDYLLARAPDLGLPQVVECLGARADSLGELWDMWGRLRPLLLRAA
jgi:hypothetical protein